jgi:diguanylate cyclase (GGDEF)-like protein
MAERGVDPTRRGIDLLLVEPEPAEALRLREMLDRSGTEPFHVTQADSMESALRMLQDCHCDAVLLDLTQPDANGLDILMRARIAASETPIVVLTPELSAGEHLQMLRFGAQDYLTREECNTRTLVRAISQAVERHRILRELRTAQKTEHFLATHDALTGLATREPFMEGVHSALAYAKRNGKNPALLFIDLDHFKAINDSLGHSAGDKLLKFVADRLSSVTRRSDLVARLAGDEFVQLALDAKASGAAIVAQKVLDTLSEPYFLEGHESRITASIGVALFPGDGNDPDELLRNADMAMYRAKMDGRNHFQFCSESLNQAAATKLRIRTGLSSALAEERFSLVYQPVRDLRTGRITAAEALLRWTDPEGRSVSPGDFVPIAESSGLIVPMGEWVLRTACAQGRAWQDQGLQPIRIAVNLSPRQLRERTLVATTTQILEESGLVPSWLELEITEGALVESDSQALATLDVLSQLGTGLSLDDFGTGYSALSYLRRFPFDRVKVDRSFVVEVATNSDAAALASAIVSMSKSLGLHSLAEGIETEEQAAFFSERGCDEVQGFLIGRPMPAEEFGKLLSREKTGDSAPPRRDGASGEAS